MRSLPTLLLASALATLACSPPATIPSSTLTLHGAPRQVVRVTNRNWANMELFAIRGGTRRVLGTVAGAQEATLVLSDDMLDSDGRLQLAARIEGQREMLMMEPVRIPVGNYVDWSLENDLARSSIGYFPHM
jgi:hypothetical protein